MNKYVRAAVCVPYGIMITAWTRLFHIRSFSASWIGVISPFSEITLDKKGELRLGRRFRLRGGAKLRVRTGARLEIGENVCINHNCMIVCRDHIKIGDDVQFSPNVLIYDHDHDYRTEGGVKKMQYKTSSVEIGDNVWLGANSVILRGSRIGDNCVIAAGTVVRGEYPADSLIYQKRETFVKPVGHDREE